MLRRGLSAAGEGLQTGQERAYLDCSRDIADLGQSFYALNSVCSIVV
jgi:hypothetical protein